MIEHYPDQPAHEGRGAVEVDTPQKRRERLAASATQLLRTKGEYILVRPGSFHRPVRRGRNSQTGWALLQATRPVWHPDIKLYVAVCDEMIEAETSVRIVGVSKPDPRKLLNPETRSQFVSIHVKSADKEVYRDKAIPASTEVVEGAQTIVEFINGEIPDRLSIVPARRLPRIDLHSDQFEGPQVLSLNDGNVGRFIEVKDAA